MDFGETRIDSMTRIDSVELIKDKFYVIRNYQQNSSFPHVMSDKLTLSFPPPQLSPMIV